jgi:hypothetical protein
VTAVPPEEYVVEVLYDDAAETDPVTSIADVEIAIGTVFGNAEPMIPDVVEVPEYPPVGGGYYHAEVLPFSKVGVLSVTTEPVQFPIAAATYKIGTIAARVRLAPTGSPVILDVRKNGVTIFTTPADRPTIAAGANSAVVGNYGTVMLADGDYLEAIIAAVGSTSPGQTLTMAIRLYRVG